MKRLASVLVIRLSSLGDVLFALPAVQALRDSGRAERVSWLVEDRAAALLRDVAGWRDLLVFPRSHPARWPAHAARLWARRDDAVVDLQGNLKSRLQRWFLRAPRTFGFDSSLARDGAQKGLTDPLQPPPGARHRVTQGMALVAALGVRAPRPVPRPALALTAASLQRADEALQALPGRGPLVVLHPGTSAFGELKRWSPARFGELAEVLRARADARVLVTGGPAEAGLKQALLSCAGGHAREAPTASLADLAALLSRASLVVAADSLPLHLANALGTPVVGLYGPKDPAVTGPFWDRAEVLRAGVACSPCTLRRCSDRICMERLAVQDVAAAANRLLAS